MLKEEYTTLKQVPSKRLGIVPLAGTHRWAAQTDWRHQMRTWQREIAEYEADLYGVQEPSFLSKLLGLRMKSGEMEITEYDDGEKAMEIEFHGVSVPEGVIVSAVVDGTAICQIEVNRGHGRFLLRTARGETIPNVSSGSVAEIHYLGQALLEGTFETD